MVEWSQSNKLNFHSQEMVCLSPTPTTIWQADPSNCHLMYLIPFTTRIPNAFQLPPFFLFYELFTISPPQRHDTWKYFLPADPDYSPVHWEKNNMRREILIFRECSDMTGSLQSRTVWNIKTSSDQRPQHIRSSSHFFSHLLDLNACM